MVERPARDVPLRPGPGTFRGELSMGLVRVRPASQGGPCAVRHPEHGEYVVPNPAQPYRDDDPLVAAYPWLFVSDEQAAGVEQATAAPGEKRITRRR